MPNAAAQRGAASGRAGRVSSSDACAYAAGRPAAGGHAAASGVNRPARYARRSADSASYVPSSSRALIRSRVAGAVGGLPPYALSRVTASPATTVRVARERAPAGPLRRGGTVPG